jgi:hypothetical protein
VCIGQFADNETSTPTGCRRRFKNLVTGGKVRVTSEAAQQEQNRLPLLNIGHSRKPRTSFFVIISSHRQNNDQSASLQRRSNSRPWDAEKWRNPTCSGRTGSGFPRPGTLFVPRAPLIWTLNIFSEYCCEHQTHCQLSSHRPP